MRKLPLATLLLASVSLGACSTWKPPEISYDDTPRQAVLQSDPPKPVQIVELPKLLPLPDQLKFAEAGPLLCGGITVFNPLAMYAKPTSRVGIVGIGGLGHHGQVRLPRQQGAQAVTHCLVRVGQDDLNAHGRHSVLISD